MEAESARGNTTGRGSCSLSALAYWAVSQAPDKRDLLEQQSAHQLFDFGRFLRLEQSMSYESKAWVTRETNGSPNFSLGLCVVTIISLHPADTM